jgi:excisionase family DNA binding protein
VTPAEGQDVRTVMSMGRLLKAVEVQEMLGLGRSKVYEMMAGGELPVVDLGPRSRRVPAEGLMRLIAARTSPALEAESDPTPLRMVRA